MRPVAVPCALGQPHRTDSTLDLNGRRPWRGPWRGKTSGVGQLRARCNAASTHAMQARRLGGTGMESRRGRSGWREAQPAFNSAVEGEAARNRPEPPQDGTTGEAEARWKTTPSPIQERQACPSPPCSTQQRCESRERSRPVRDNAIAQREPRYAGDEGKRSPVLGHRGGSRKERHYSPSPARVTGEGETSGGSTEVGALGTRWEWRISSQRSLTSDHSHARVRPNELCRGRK